MKLRVRAVFLGLSIALVASASRSSEAQPSAPKPGRGNAAGSSNAELEKRFQDDVAEGSVVVMSESGDLVFFGGAVTVPARRPSVEACGEWVSIPARERPAKLAALRKSVTDRAEAERYTPKDRFEAMKKATEPMKQCEALFKARCDEVRGKVALPVRQSAIQDVKKSLRRIVDEKQRQAVGNYLESVLDQCPLDS